MQNAVIRVLVAAIIAGSLPCVASASEATAADPTLSAPSSSNSADPALVASYIATRESWARNPNINLPDLSKVIRAALTESQSLIQKKENEAALKRLQQLESYAPLPNFPSSEVQVTLMLIYLYSGEMDKIKAQNARVIAMRDLLMRYIGSGDTAEDAKRVLMPNEVTEWMRSINARVISVTSRPQKGREIQEITYVGPSTGNQPKAGYFELDRRYQAAQNRQLRLFDPFPMEKFGPRELAALEEAREKRNRFLDDKSFAYDVLLAKIRESMKASATLASQGKYQEALEKLREIETVRPIEEIPMVDLLSLYSGLHGRLGNSEKQLQIRLLLFGISQAIAHSGDGLSPETAVEVLMVSEEYAWLHDKGLKRIRQRIYDTSKGKYDVLTARDASGSERDYYFNITRMYPRGAESALGRVTNQ